MAVYPIALFTYDKPMRPEPNVYEVSFPDRTVLTFRFRTIQLNQLNWRDFVRQPNPVAAALMAKMNVAPGDRPKVKVQCLRLMATLKLNKAKQALIAEFVTAYLKLNEAEMKVYNQEVRELQPVEREAVMNLVNEWEEIGEKRGVAIGEARGEARGEAKAATRMVARLLRHKFGDAALAYRDRIDALSTDTLESLAEMIHDFGSTADLDSWLEARRAL